jgi:prolyl-tRNA synthetase
VDERKDFYDWFTPKNQDKPEIHGGFAMSHWCGNEACESKIKTDLNVTIRCIPLDARREKGPCICCGESSDTRVVFAKAY